jgi:hypothetical protein
MPAHVIENDRMPTPLGPYSHAVAAHGELVFISGQAGMDPSTGEVPADFQQQARNAFENLSRVVERGRPGNGRCGENDRLPRRRFAVRHFERAVWRVFPRVSADPRHAHRAAAQGAAHLHRSDCRPELSISAFSFIPGHWRRMAAFDPLQT